MSTAKNVLGVVPGVMSLGLVGESLKTVEDIGKKKKGNAKGMIDLTVKTMVGVPMISAVSKQINALP